MGETENNNLSIINTDDKTYNLENTEEAIDFLVYALNGKYYTLFTDFVFGHLGINFYQYLESLKDGDKNILVVLNDVSPFFDLIVEDFENNNIFYKYIYSHPSSDLVKKQKINKIIDGLKKTLDYNFDFHSASIFRNMYVDMSPDFYKLAYEKEFSFAYIYFCVTFKLMSIYDYIHKEFYSFVEEKNKFDYFYSHKYKDFIKNKNEKKVVQTNIKETPIDIWKNVFYNDKDFENFRYYLKHEINDEYNDLSYLFHRLKRDGKMVKIKHKQFMEWMFNNGLIKEFIYDKLIEKNSFSTKAENPDRIRKYDNVFKN
ncbi:hypothetical protein [Flavobacterium sp. CAN_S2]|uniref:hypothetical protein n=1 Tax=Flavobacterium sp. CAN_S2 TaxID=2787726 RepID=UPI0018CB36D6